MLCTPRGAAFRAPALRKSPRPCCYGAKLSEKIPLVLAACNTLASSAVRARALTRRAARLRRVIDPDRRHAPAVRSLRSDALFCIHSFLGCLLHAAPTPPTRRHDAVAMGGGTRTVFAAALLCAAAAAADNATHTIVATVLNAKYVPLFELWHPRFAAATDATVELVVACLDDEAVAAVRRVDGNARTLEATGGAHDVAAARLAKVNTVLRLVREEAAGARRPVIYSDVDAFWLESPLSRLRRIDAALAFSRDGVATAAGFDARRGFALCAGFFVARPTDEAAAWLDAWRHKGRGGRNSDQVAANELYDEGVGIIADDVVDRCPRAAAPLVWHPYSPARIPGKVDWWGRVLAKVASGDGAAFAGVRCSWAGRHKGRNRRPGGGA